jgi:hypothetical protein
VPRENENLRLKDRLCERPQGTNEEEPRKSLSEAAEKIQWLLLKLGSDLGLDIWVARNDRNRTHNGRLQKIPSQDGAARAVRRRHKQDHRADLCGMAAGRCHHRRFRGGAHHGDLLRLAADVGSSEHAAQHQDRPFHGSPG